MLKPFIWTRFKLGLVYDKMHPSVMELPFMMIDFLQNIVSGVQQFFAYALLFEIGTYQFLPVHNRVMALVWC